MKYYWSCWFTEEQLKSMGAVGIITARFNYCSYIISRRTDDLVVWDSQYLWDSQYDNHYTFQAEDSFPVFLKLKHDKNAAEISKRYYSAIQRGDKIKIAGRSKIGKSLRGIVLDF